MPSSGSSCSPQSSRARDPTLPARCAKVPYLVAHQLAAAAPQTRGMRTRGRPARRRPTHLIRERTTRRTGPPAPPAREMHPGRRRLALTQSMLCASRARSRPANRAPLLQPPGVIAHDPVLAAVTGDDGGFRRVRPSAGPRPSFAQPGPSIHLKVMYPPRTLEASEESPLTHCWRPQKA